MSVEADSKGCRVSVYVDPLSNWPKGWGPGKRYGRFCHLFGDDPEELHVFAALIGLKRSWAQGGGTTGRMLHYDITAEKRAEAVRTGAVELSLRRARVMISAKVKAARKVRRLGKRRIVD
jgi:hypothetical protein